MRPSSASYTATAAVDSRARGRNDKRRPCGDPAADGDARRTDADRAFDAVRALNTMCAPDPVRALDAPRECGLGRHHRTHIFRAGWRSAAADGDARHRNASNATHVSDTFRARDAVRTSDVVRAPDARAPDAAHAERALGKRHRDCARLPCVGRRDERRARASAAVDGAARRRDASDAALARDSVRASGGIRDPDARGRGQRRHDRAYRAARLFREHQRPLGARASAAAAAGCDAWRAGRDARLPCVRVPDAARVPCARAPDAIDVPCARRDARARGHRRHGCARLSHDAARLFHDRCSCASAASAADARRDDDGPDAARVPEAECVPRAPARGSALKAWRERTPRDA